MDKLNHCPSCNKEAAGAYCGTCGEKLEDVHVYSTWQFLKQSFGVITNLDGKFYQTFLLLVKKPGNLAEAYLIGQRKPYLRPIQLFLIANVVYFLVQPLTVYNPLNNTLSSHMYRQVYSAQAEIERVVKEEVARRDVPFEQFEAVFNQKAVTFAKTFVFIQIPIFAFLLYLFFGRSRKYFVEHLVFSVHFYAFILFFVFSIFLFFFGWGYRYLLEVFLWDYIENSPNGQLMGRIADLISEQSAGPLTFAYLYFATRRFYKESKIMCFVKTLILCYLFLYVMYLYRFILFWITFYSM